MNKSILPCVATVFSMVCLCATAETVTPLKGQPPEIIQQDIGACDCAGRGTTGPSTCLRAGAGAGGTAGLSLAGAYVLLDDFRGLPFERRHGLGRRAQADHGENRRDAR